VQNENGADEVRWRGKLRKEKSMREMALNESYTGGHQAVGRNL